MPDNASTHPGTGAGCSAPKLFNYAAPQWNVHPNPGIGYSLWLTLAPCSVYSNPLLLFWVAIERALDYLLACEKHARAEADTQRIERHKTPFDERSKSRSKRVVQDRLKRSPPQHPSASLGIILHPESLQQAFLTLDHRSSCMYADSSAAKIQCFIC